MLAEPALLRGDPELPFLATALRPEGMTPLLNRRVLPGLGRETSDGTGAIDYILYSPGKECVVRYAFPGSGVQALITIANDDRLEKVYARHYGREATGDAAYLPDERALVEIFPADWML